MLVIDGYLYSLVDGNIAIMIVSYAVNTKYETEAFCMDAIATQVCSCAPDCIAATFLMTNLVCR